MPCLPASDAIVVVLPLRRTFGCPSTPKSWKALH